MLYQTIIKPIEILLEVVFMIAYRLLDNPGIAIIIVSIVVNVVLLPMYSMAENIQSEEHRKQVEMRPWTEHIRRSFHGDERFMMLSTYYREMQYHPIYALRVSLSLALQLPFFIAAYRFLGVRRQFTADMSIHHWNYITGTKSEWLTSTTSHY